MAGYWDGPEGEQCPQRTWLATRVGAAAGLVGAAYRIILLRPGSALAALQMAAADSVTMGKSRAPWHWNCRVGLPHTAGAPASPLPALAAPSLLPLPLPLHGFATLGAVFGLSTCLSAQVREEPEDPLNYFIGGCAAGAVLGVRAHSYFTGTTACLGFGITAALMKI
ncbi:NADH dehydrogenase, partial [Lamprotornis superbus]